MARRRRTKNQPVAVGLAPTVELAPTEIIVGVHAVAEALAAGEDVREVIVTRHRMREPAVKPLLDDARTRGIEIRIQDEGWFRASIEIRRASKFARQNQGIAARVAPFAYAPFGDVRRRARARENCLIVALDHIEDPQNLGAILRNSEGAGADAVVIPGRRAVQVTPAVRRAAAGAASHLRVASVPNLARSLADLKADGCWVFGLAPDGTLDYTEADFGGRTVIVIGSEGRGLHRLVAQHCDQLARIPLHGKVGSLNAASSAAVVLFEAVRQRAGNPPAKPPDKQEKARQSLTERAFGPYNR